MSASSRQPPPLPARPSCQQLPIMTQQRRTVAPKSPRWNGRQGHRCWNGATTGCGRPPPGMSCCVTPRPCSIRSTPPRGNSPACPPRRARSAWAGLPARAPACCPAPSRPCAAPIPPSPSSPGKAAPPRWSARCGSAAWTWPCWPQRRFRPPDAETPPLDLQVLAERSLCLPVPATHPLARQNAADVADLRGQRWIASPTSADETLMGVWPGLDERPTITHTARDWLSKLHLVAAGCGLTTVPASFAAIVPPGVRVLAVHGGSREQRRVILARTRPPSQPPASPTPCAPQPPTCRPRGSPHQPRTGTRRSRSSSPVPSAKEHQGR